MIDMQGAFVIQQHFTNSGFHFDLMLENGESLATWQLDSLPDAPVVGQPWPARKLADHRNAYLTYEGPISGGRGRVCIADHGSFQADSVDPRRWEFCLAGRQVQGRFELLCLNGDSWRLTRID